MFEELNIDHFNKSNPNYLLQIIDGELVCIDNDPKHIKVDQENLSKKIERSGIPFRYCSLNLSELKVDQSIIQQAQLYVDKFKPKTFWNIYLEGQQTVGKTSVACCIAKELIKNGFIGQFMYAGELSNILRDYHGYGSNSDNAKLKLDILEQKDFLYIDDMFDINKDVVYRSTNLAGQWDVFLRKMLDSGMNIIMTSNTLKKNINENYGVSIQELIDRNFHLTISFKESIKGTIIADGKNDLANRFQS